LLKPSSCKANKQFDFNAVSLAIHDLPSCYTDKLTIKWPNDIYVGNKNGWNLGEYALGNKIDCQYQGMNINQLDFENPNALLITD
jgi:biotin-(acetyl-CoA carboxylase) ligase